MPPVTVVSWNLNRNAVCWAFLAEDPEVDVALVQEAQPPPTELGVEAVPGSWDWRTRGARRDFCTAVARLSDRVSVRYPANRPLNDPGGPVLPVSLKGSIALAEVSVPGHDPVTVASVYCAWESVPQDGSGWIVSDAAAHRVLSDRKILVKWGEAFRARAGVRGGAPLGA